MRILLLFLALVVACHCSNNSTTTTTVAPSTTETPSTTSATTKKPGESRGKRNYRLGNYALAQQHLSQGIPIQRRNGYTDPRGYFTIDESYANPYSTYAISDQNLQSDPTSYLPDYYPNPQYAEQPEPIIEIIIKESNDTLPAPPPVSYTQKKKKEQVQVYYVNYKKDHENNLHLEKPIAALTPPGYQGPQEEEEEIIHYPAVTPLPPAKTTTLRTVIHPDSEKYHSNSGIHVTFGTEDKNQYGHQLQEHNEESVLQSVVALPNQNNYIPEPSRPPNFVGDSRFLQQQYRSEFGGQPRTINNFNNNPFKGPFQNNIPLAQTYVSHQQELPQTNPSQPFRQVHSHQYQITHLQQPNQQTEYKFVQNVNQLPQQHQQQQFQQQQEQHLQQQLQQQSPQPSAIPTVLIRTHPTFPPGQGGPTPVPTKQPVRFPVQNSNPTSKSTSQYQQVKYRQQSPPHKPVPIPLQNAPPFEQQQQPFNRPLNFGPPAHLPPPQSQHTFAYDKRYNKPQEVPYKQKPILTPTKPSVKQPAPQTLQQKKYFNQQQQYQQVQQQHQQAQQQHQQAQQSHQQARQQHQQVQQQHQISQQHEQIQQQQHHQAQHLQHQQSQQQQQQQQQHQQQQQQQQQQHQQQLQQQQQQHQQQKQQQQQQHQQQQQQQQQQHQHQKTQQHQQIQLHGGLIQQTAPNLGSRDNAYLANQQDFENHQLLQDEYYSQQNNQQKLPLQQTQPIRFSQEDFTAQQNHQIQQQVQNHQHEYFNHQNNQDLINHQEFANSVPPGSEFVKSVPKFEQHITETVSLGQLNQPFGRSSDYNNQVDSKLAFNEFGSHTSHHNVIQNVPAPRLGPTTPTPSQTPQYEQYFSSTPAPHFTNFVSQQPQYISSTPPPHYHFITSSTQQPQFNQHEQVQIVTPVPSTQVSYQSQQQQQQQQQQYFQNNKNSVQPQIIPNSQPHSTVPAKLPSPGHSVSTIHTDVFSEIEQRKKNFLTQNNKQNYVEISGRTKYQNAQPSSSTTSTTPAPTTRKPANKPTIQLPDEVPDDLRQQLLSSGILDNADISVLDYDKLGDTALENLPPEHLANFYGAGGGSQISESNRILTVVKPNGEKVNFTEKQIEKMKASLPKKQNVDLKVVRFDSNNQKSVTDKYIKQDSTVLPAVDISAQQQYNRYLPLKVSGAQFPIPDASEIKGKKIASVVVLAPVDTLQSIDDYGFDGRQERDILDTKEIKFIAGDILKQLVKKPSKDNFRRWLEKESKTDIDLQSVVLLVAKNSADEQEIYMYDIGTKVINKLNGELSTAFVNVAEENAGSEDFENARISDSGIIERMSTYDETDPMESEDDDVEAAGSSIHETFVEFKRPSDDTQLNDRISINSGYSVIKN